MKLGVGVVGACGLSDYDSLEVILSFPTLFSSSASIETSLGPVCRFLSLRRDGRVHQIRRRSSVRTAAHLRGAHDAIDCCDGTQVYSGWFQGAWYRYVWSLLLARRRSSRPPRRFLEKSYEGIPRPVRKLNPTEGVASSVVFRSTQRRWSGEQTSSCKPRQPLAACRNAFRWVHSSAKTTAHETMPEDLEGSVQKYEIIASVWRMMKLRSLGRSVSAQASSSGSSRSAELSQGAQPASQSSEVKALANEVDILASTIKLLADRSLTGGKGRDRSRSPRPVKRQLNGNQKKAKGKDKEALPSLNQ